MNSPAVREPHNVVGLQERRLDRTVLRTYRTKADIDDIVPNEKQPRMGPKIDEELQRQIEAKFFGIDHEMLWVIPKAFHEDYGNMRMDPTNFLQRTDQWIILCFCNILHF